MKVPLFPDFASIELSLKTELEPFFRSLDDGICENSFASLFLAGCVSPLEISRAGERCYLVRASGTAADSGQQDSGRFLRIAGDFPAAGQLQELLRHPALAGCGTLRDIPAAAVPGLPFRCELDRDNCDYLYQRGDLAELKGKAFHKKKNLVNQFCGSYTAALKALDASTDADARHVLDMWTARSQEQGGDGGDAKQCSLALRYREELGLYGFVLYADGSPVAFSLGEELCGGTMFDCHFEKGVDGVHGVYQAINYFTARALPEHVTLINREQDLGNAGLRQAKQTYRPCGMVEKFRCTLKEAAPQRM